VQALVSRARRLGVPVIAGPGGYRVPADQVEVDAVTARALVERARAALRSGDAGTARKAADEARALFPEIPELADADATRLFGDVVAVRAEAALAGEGSYEEADLRRLAERTPPDEPATALLVRMLAAQGRDAEALEVVERLRAELADRYGTDPSPVITQVHLALLRGELVAEPHRRPRTAHLPTSWRRQGTPLVGRDRDVAAVTEALADTFLVTIVATGGAGKTRLAAEVARCSAAAGRTVRVVELAGLRSPDEVLPAVLAALGGADTAAAGSLTHDRRVLSPAERLGAVAPGIDGLLVLDNCEHVLDDAVAVVADLLAVASPEVAVLATSRAPLGLVGEVVYRLAALPDAEALRLLEARTRAGGAAPTWDTDRALELCHRLDNLPLALELAAARLRNMPIEDVLAGLTDRFALLDDALRGLPERHASLWAMVDWSRELLAPAERELLERLAVIPAPFTADLAVAVSGGLDVRQPLAALVEQSLLTLDEGDGGTPRYRMLETVREYGEARLDAAEARESAMSGLVAWARERAVALAADFIGPGQVEALARCAADQDNLVAALRWSLARDDEPAEVDLATALFHLWTVQGLHLEVSGWAHTLLRADDPAARRRSAILHGRATGRSLPNADRLAWLSLIVGVNAGITGPPRLNALARRALRTLSTERPAEVSPRYAALGSVLPVLELTDSENSLRATTELIAHSDPYVQALGLFARAALRENDGQTTASVGDAEQAYRRFQAVGDHWGMGMAAQVLGYASDTDRAVSAGEWLRRSERHMELVGAVQDARSIRVVLDVQMALAGDPDAEVRLREAAASDQIEEFDTAQAQLGLAHLAWQREQYDEALGYTDAVARTMAVAGAGPPPQLGVMIRVALAVLRLRVAEARPTPGAAANADAQTVEVLTSARGEVLSAHDNPVLGVWALGGAELAAFRGDSELARELWALGIRFGANAGRLFPQRHGERLAAALGDEVDREPLRAALRKRSVAVITARIRELMDDLLA
jgi:predicted ATPase